MWKKDPQHAANRSFQGPNVDTQTNSIKSLNHKRLAWRNSTNKDISQYSRIFNSLIFNPRGCSLQRTVGSDPGLTTKKNIYHFWICLTQKRCLKTKQHQIISNPTTYGFCMNMKIWGSQFGGQESDATFDRTSQNACKYWEIYTRCSKLRHLSISLQMANAFWCIIKIPLPDFRASWKDPLPNIYENTALSGAPSLPLVVAGLPNCRCAAALPKSAFDCLKSCEKFTPHHVLSEGCIITGVQPPQRTNHHGVLCGNRHLVYL